MPIYTIGHSNHWKGQANFCEHMLYLSTCPGTIADILKS